MYGTWALLQQALTSENQATTRFAAILLNLYLEHAHQNIGAGENKCGTRSTCDGHINTPKPGCPSEEI